MGSNDLGSDLFRVWYRDVVEIKHLFHLRKYKHCAARCEELQTSAVHPIHKTFLSFYQALSYESLGMSAHMYSNNKLPLLNLAKDYFGLALQTLPPPADGSPALGDSACATLAVVKRYQHSSPLTDSSTAASSRSNFSIQYRANSSDNIRIEPSSSPASSAYLTDSPVSDDLNWEADSACGNLKTHMTLPPCLKLNLVSPTLLNTPEAQATNTSTHKARLSQALSPNHYLAKDLVPSPLFNKCRKVVSVPATPQTPPKPPVHPESLEHPSEAHDELKHEPHLPRDISEETHTGHTSLEFRNERPLPPLPFNHKPHFERRGTRHVLIPTAASKSAKQTPGRPRATAIETLVAKFEGKIQEASPGRFPVSPNMQYPQTPLTPRFRMIGQIFAIKDEHRHELHHEIDVHERQSGIEHGVEDDATHTDSSRARNNPPVPTSSTMPSTPTPNPVNLPLTTPPPPSHLNAPISSFRTTLKTHLTDITSRIATVEAAQQARVERNATLGLGGKKYMSFWSFDALSTREGEERRGRRRG